MRPLEDEGLLLPNEVSAAVPNDIGAYREEVPIVVGGSSNA